MIEVRRKDPFLGFVNAFIVFFISCAASVAIGYLHGLGDLQWSTLYCLYIGLSVLAGFLFALIVFITTYYNNV